jgi:glycosyltransferase involved in cell wall biosynthesis
LALTSEATKPLRVLLFSPVGGRDPASGDISYTESLLSDPPPGVVYTTYAEALHRGWISVRGRRRAAGSLDRALLMVRILEAALRRLRIMFREPAWFVSIEPGRFELVHQHLFAVRQVGPRLPVFSSAGYPLDVRYIEHDSWPRWRAHIARALERTYSRALRIHNPWAWHVDPAISSGYTEAFRRHLVAQGVPAAASFVLSTYLPDDGISTAPNVSDGRTLVFIGRDFVRKGGPVALAAFERMVADDPSLKLLVITTAGQGEAISGPGVELLCDVARANVMDLLSAADVMLLPTGSDCGAPYGVLEALRAGCGVVLSQAQWLDPRLEGAAVARVEATPSAVERAARQLLESRRLDHEGGNAAARDLWRTHFSSRPFQSELLRGYDAARRRSAAHRDAVRSSSL